jgi:hypothetical protein
VPWSKESLKKGFCGDGRMGYALLTSVRRIEQQRNYVLRRGGEELQESRKGTGKLGCRESLWKV